MRRDRVVRMARAIREYEGWYPGSVSFRNNNPGNLRSWPGKARRDGYAVFESEWEGFRALCHMIERAAAGKSRIYRSDMTLVEFFEQYAPPSDNNDPEQYARFVAFRLGVSPDTKLCDALS